MPSPEQMFQQLTAEAPQFHGEHGSFQWSLAPDVMQWLLDTVEEGDRTLETGCGYSTLIFAVKAAHHTVISPLPEEHNRIVDWGHAHGVDFSKVTFLTERSENVLPTLPDQPLDLVLIDGWHAFPAPIVDWFFTCQRLSVGGYLVVDDTQIRACRVLRDFLECEVGRWSLEKRFKRTDVFRKLKADMFEGDWKSQPYSAKPFFTYDDRLRIQMRPELLRMIKTVPFLEYWLRILFRRPIAKSAHEP